MSKKTGVLQYIYSCCLLNGNVHLLQNPDVDVCRFPMVIV